MGAVLLSLSVGLVLVARSSERARQSADQANRQLYRTAISAANYALTLNDVAAARAHLETIEDQGRGWEWQYVNRQLEPWLFDFETGADPIGYPRLPSLGVGGAGAE